MTIATELRSTLTCPLCGHAETLTMAEDSCQIVYDCPGCGARLTPKSGDCCVFCSYGDVPCPPVQREKGCCSP
jgi:NADH pyrophosphatase NudC (nudix superfamily)